MANASIAHIGQFYQRQHNKNDHMKPKSGFSRFEFVRPYARERFKEWGKTSSFFATSPPLRIIDIFL